MTKICETCRAISIVAFDPTGKTTGQTFPPDSVWMGTNKEPEIPKRWKSRSKTVRPVKTCLQTLDNTKAENVISL